MTNLLRRVALLSLVASIAMAARGGGDVDPNDIERVAVAVERVLAEPRRLEGVVRRRIYFGAPGGREAPPIRPDRDAANMDDRAAVRVLGPAHATVLQGERAFVDVLFKGVGYGVNLSERDCVAERGSGASDRSGFGFSLLTQSSLFGMLDTPEPLPAAIRESLPLSLEFEGTVATYRFRVASEQRTLDARATQGGPAGEAWARSITVDLADPPRILGWSTDVPRRGLDQPFEPDRWQVEEWQELDGRSLPKRIRRDTRVPREDGSLAQYLQITEFERILPLPKDCDPQRPLPAGIRVEGDGIRFVVGSAEVIRGGEPFRLAEPLWFLPSREDLDSLMRDARPR